MRDAGGIQENINSGHQPVWRVYNSSEHGLAWMAAQLKRGNACSTNRLVSMRTPADDADGAGNEQDTSQGTF